MKFAVHWAPAVSVWTPGWIVADEAGAQALAVVGTAARTATTRMSTRAFLNIRNALYPV
jgi:hypothetical protein